MRQPFFSLDDQRITECDGDGLSWPDDIVDEALISSLPVLDDAFLEALGIDCSPPAPMDMDVDVWVTQSPAAGPKTNSSGDHQYSTPSASSSRRSLSSTTSSWEPSPGSASPYRRWDVPTKPRRQPAAVRKRPWSHPSLSFGVPALHEAPADLDGHGVGAVNVGEFCYDIDSKPSKFSYGGSKLGHGNNVGDSGIGHRRSAGRQRDQPEGQRCGHCHVTETPQWRNGPDGPGTLCNACGIRYRMGSDKLVPEYRPSTSPFFRSGEHSNRNRKVQKLREKKVKALKLYGDGGGSGAPGGTLTPAKVADNVDTNSIL